MALAVREMRVSEAGLIIDYMHGSSPEHLELLGVDPTRLPAPADWRQSFEREYALPVEQRTRVAVIWLSDERPVGFSTCDKIRFGESANMHLHITQAEHRHQGIGTECVRRSVDVYFDMLPLKRLYCEPNAFNIAPNRALQKAGFKYVKTHMTVPGPFNFHQPVTRWVLER